MFILKIWRTIIKVAILTGGAGTRLAEETDKKETLYPKQHRSLIADIAKRSRYFLVNPGKIDRQVETRGQSEIGYCFFEGAASGTVMIGEAPKNEAFGKYFD